VFFTAYENQAGVNETAEFRDKALLRFFFGSLESLLTFGARPGRGGTVIAEGGEEAEGEGETGGSSLL
jgi:hypothetical protein